MNLFKTMAVANPEAASQAIPVIDVGPAFRGEPGGLEAVARQVGHASETVGCVYVAGHGVPQAFIDDAFQASREFHSLPLDEKLALNTNENNIGYRPVNQTMQRHSTVHKATRPNFNESFFISHDRDAEHPDIVAGTPLRGRNQWPAGHERMRATMVRYMKAMETLGERTLPVLARALEMPADHFAPFFWDEAHITTRFLHYPHQDTDDDEQFGQGPHTDNSFITFLASEDKHGPAVHMPNCEWLALTVIPVT